MVNPAMIFKMKSMWDEFSRNHPKLLGFFQAVGSHPLEEGTVVEMIINRPGGEAISANIMLKASDIGLINQIKEMGTNGMQ